MSAHGARRVLADIISSIIKKNEVDNVDFLPRFLYFMAVFGKFAIFAIFILLRKRLKMLIFLILLTLYP